VSKRSGFGGSTIKSKSAITRETDRNISITVVIFKALNFIFGNLTTGISLMGSLSLKTL
jgi:hypothetical protein